MPVQSILSMTACNTISTYQNNIPIQDKILFSYSWNVRIQNKEAHAAVVEMQPSKADGDVIRTKEIAKKVT